MEFLIEWIEKGGIVMYPLIALSIISWFIIIERAINLRFSKFIPKNINEIKLLIQKGDYESAFRVSQVTQHEFLNALSIVLKEYMNGRRNKVYLIQLMESELSSFVPKVEKNLVLLSTIASVSPLLGLFGTITGLIKVFSAFAIAQQEQALNLLAKGISEALVAAATGLAVAIPALLAFWIYRALGNTVLDKISELAKELINSLE